MSKAKKSSKPAPAHEQKTAELDLTPQPLDLSSETLPTLPVNSPLSAPERVSVTSKSEAIRRAISAGHDKPTAGVAYIKSQFGLDVSPAMFSSVKQAAQKKSGTQTGTGNSGRPRLALTRPTGSLPSMELFQQIKELTRTYGADAVQQAVLLFSD